MEPGAADVLRARLGYGPLSGPSGGSVAPVAPAAAAPLTAPVGGVGGGDDRLAAAFERFAGALEARRPPEGGGIALAYGFGVGAAASDADYDNLWTGTSSGSGGGGGGYRMTGHLALERIRRTREERPELVTVAHERTARANLRVLPGESWSWLRHAYSEVLLHVEKLR